MKPRYQYIVGNLYSQGRFAEKQNFNFCFVPPERSQSQDETVIIRVAAI
jgi:hypothetical protein